MFYERRDFIRLSLLYNESDIEGDFASKLLFKNLFAKTIDTSVQMKISIWDHPGTVMDYFDSLEQNFTKKPIYHDVLVPFKEKMMKMIHFAQFDSHLERRVEEEIILCGEHDIQIVCLEDLSYPEKAKQMEAPPPVLYCKGTMPSFQDLEQSVAVIGMHQPEEVYTPMMAEFVAKELRDKGWWNISGLSRGCDTYGHIASLELGGKTAAVVPFGLASSVYPLENTLLADAIIERGGFLLSENIPSRSANEMSIVLRDRIQSAITTALFVLETDINSNTLITVDCSLKSKKTIFVFDPSGTVLENDPVVSGNVLLLSLKNQNQEQGVFSYDNYKDSHIIGVTHGEVFQNWLDYMNGNEENLRC